MRAALAIVVALCTTAPRVWAQPNAAADVLFDEAKALMEQQQYPQACAKFEASLKLDPALGTSLNLGDCYERIGKLASAWSMYRAVADRARLQMDPREQLATERATRLEPRLPKIQITITGAPAPGFAVARDGALIDPALFGSTIYADPGTTKIVASAPGRTSHEVTLELQEGATEAITIPVLAIIVGDSARHRDPPAAIVDYRRSPTRVRIGIAAIGGGVGLAVTGTIVGLLARGPYDEAFESGDCDRVTRRCNAEGQAQTDIARRRATVGTVLIGGGIVAIGVGVAIVVLAPKVEVRSRISVSPAVGADSVGIAVTGAWR